MILEELILSKEWMPFGDKIEGWVIATDVQEGKVPDSASGMGQL